MTNKYYAVKKGKSAGIYKSWDECKVQVEGFPGAEYKSFKSEQEALDYIGDSVEYTSLNKSDQNVNKSKSLYIARDIIKLTQLLDDTAKSIWTDVIGKGIKEVGQQKRYTFEVNGAVSILDIYQRGDGQTTLRPTGSNIENAIKLQKAIELRGYKATSEQKQYTMFVGEDWIEKTVQYLSDLCDGKVEKYEEEGHNRYVFVSDIGDKLTLNTYSNHRIMVQGKPLYLYNEFLAYVSYSPKVEMNDIIKATNEFVDTNTDVDEARNKMSDMMPTAYAGDIDPVIWKLFSPSVTLIDVEKEFQDYSCFVFPALRALEGYLKYLLAEKNIVIDRTHNFGTVFGKDANNKAVVIQKYVTDIADTDYIQALEEIYNYFKTHRHVIFHVDQIFMATRVIETKQEALSIINDVAALIERTYKKAIK